MTTFCKKTLLIVAALLTVFVGSFILLRNSGSDSFVAYTPAIPGSITLSGRYVCLPLLLPNDLQTKECKFGLQTENGDYYAVNFGQSASAAEQFRSRAYIAAEGFIVDKETLNSSEWAPFRMKGIFTITRMTNIGL